VTKPWYRSSLRKSGYNISQFADSQQLTIPGLAPWEGLVRTGFGLFRVVGVVSGCPWATTINLRSGKCLFYARFLPSTAVTAWRLRSGFVSDGRHCRSCGKTCCSLACKIPVGGLLVPMRSHSFMCSIFLWIFLSVLLLGNTGFKSPLLRRPIFWHGVALKAAKHCKCEWNWDQLASSCRASRFATWLLSLKPAFWLFCSRNQMQGSFFGRGTLD